MPRQHWSRKGKPLLCPRGPDRWREARKRAIEILGGRCVGCGFSDWRALQFDHIECKDVKPRSTESTWDILRKILEGNTSEFQLLCANCNWIKRYEKEEHGNNGVKKLNRFTSIITDLLETKNAH